MNDNLLATIGDYLMIYHLLSTTGDQFMFINILNTDLDYIKLMRNVSGANGMQSMIDNEILIILQI